MKILTAQFSNKANRRPGRRASPSHGMLLIECLVYITLFFLIVGVAFRIFYSCWDNAKEFRRNTDQIVSALKTGERWREDVRAANAPLRSEDSPAGRVLRIPQKSGEIDYLFSESALWRRSGADADWTEVLPKIKSSRMEPDARAQVTAWRWEVELATRRKAARVVPLFTFEAVPQKTQQP